MKVYWKKLRLKVVDAVDRGTARQGVAHTREAPEKGHPGGALISQAEVRSRMVFILRLRTTESRLVKTALRWHLQLLSEVYVVRPLLWPLSEMKGIVHLPPTWMAGRCLRSGSASLKTS